MSKPNSAENTLKQLYQTTLLLYQFACDPFKKCVHLLFPSLFFYRIFVLYLSFETSFFSSIEIHFIYIHKNFYDWQKHCGLYDVVKREQKTILISPHTSAATLRCKYLWWKWLCPLSNSCTQKKQLVMNHKIWNARIGLKISPHGS